MAERRKVRPDCIYASNPFHECSEYCLRKTAESKSGKDKKYKGSFVLDISKSFGRKKGSQPKSPKEVDIRRKSRTVSTEAPHVYPVKKVESRNGAYISSTQMHSEEIHPKDPSLSMEQLDSPRNPSFGTLIMPDYPEDAPKQSPTRNPQSVVNNKNGDEKHETLSNKNLITIANNTEECARKLPSESSFSLSGIEQTIEDSDEGEVESVNSELCVSVGKYNVKASFSSILTSIFDKYGDIAATCKLESVVMRSYYLECVCYVIQELQSTEFYQLNKSKVKELLAILKDVESSQINVNWLKSRLDEIAQTIQLRRQGRAIEAAKANCEHDLESTKKKLESQIEDLALKEKELSDAKAQVAETRARLSELELKSSQLKEMIAFINSKVENFRYKSFSDDFL